MAKEQSMRFILDDLAQRGRTRGEVFSENGQLLIKLDGHGNQSEDGGPVIALFREHGQVRLLVFRDINSEEPTETLDLGGALESARS